MSKYIEKSREIQPDDRWSNFPIEVRHDLGRLEFVCGRSTNTPMGWKEQTTKLVKDERGLDKYQKIEITVDLTLQQKEALKRKTVAIIYQRYAGTDVEPVVKEIIASVPEKGTPKK